MLPYAAVSRAHKGLTWRRGCLSLCGGRAPEQDSLGGRSRMALIVCCSPSADCASETLSSLRFGCRAKGLVAAVQATCYSRTVCSSH